MSIDNSNVIDMKLASSYIPALTSVVKVLLLLIVLTTLQKLGMPISQSIITAAVCLYVDRNLSLYVIMDTNACALYTLITITINATRVELELDTALTNYVVSVLWSMCSCCFICEVHRSFIPPIAQMSMLVTAFFCGVHTFLSMPIEGDFSLYMRAILFTVFTVGWVYSERIHNIHAKPCALFTPCLDRFGLLLLIEWHTVLVFSGVVLFMLLWRQSRQQTSRCEKFDEEFTLHYPHKNNTVYLGLSNSQGCPNEVVCKKTSPEILTPFPTGASRADVTDGEELDVYSAFLIAKENSRKGVYRQ
jgi:hypothetical protein